ncbi:MAG: hypothetical protein ACK5P7_02625 [Bdellovibrio sp.]|jgi:hypothetical protein
MDSAVDHNECLLAAPTEFRGPLALLQEMTNDLALTPIVDLKSQHTFRLTFAHPFLGRGGIIWMVNDETINCRIQIAEAAKPVFVELKIECLNQLRAKMDNLKFWESNTLEAETKARDGTILCFEGFSKQRHRFFVANPFNPNSRLATLVSTFLQLSEIATPKALQ